MSMYLINVFNFLFGSLIVLTYFSQADDSDDLLHNCYKAYAEHDLISGDRVCRQIIADPEIYFNPSQSSLDWYSAIVFKLDSSDNSISAHCLTYKCNFMSKDRSFNIYIVPVKGHNMVFNGDVSENEIWLNKEPIDGIIIRLEQQTSSSTYWDSVQQQEPQPPYGDSRPSIFPPPDNNFNEYTSTYNQYPYDQYDDDSY